MRKFQESDDGFGPVYDLDTSTLKKYRRMMNGSKIKDADPLVRRAYGEAVEKAILAKQQSQLKSYGEPNIRPSCPSGTWHADGAKIENAIRMQQRNALENYPAKVRRERTPEQWAEMYAEAMKEKRN